MKGLKFSFAAIIAILAVGVTVAAQAGAFEAKSVAVDCYTPNFSTRPLANCTAVTKNIVATSACSQVLPQDHIFAISGSLVDPSICVGTSEICCVKLVVDPNPCPAQTQVDPPGALPLGFYKVSPNAADIFCEL